MHGGIGTNDRDICSVELAKNMFLLWAIDVGIEPMGCVHCSCVGVEPMGYVRCSCVGTEPVGCVGYSYIGDVSVAYTKKKVHTVTWILFSGVFCIS